MISRLIILMKLNFLPFTIGAMIMFSTSALTLFGEDFSIFFMFPTIAAANMIWAPQLSKQNNPFTLMSFNIIFPLSISKLYIYKHLLKLLYYVNLLLAFGLGLFIVSFFSDVHFIYEFKSLYFTLLVFYLMSLIIDLANDLGQIFKSRMAIMGEFLAMLLIFVLGVIIFLIVKYAGEMSGNFSYMYLFNNSYLIGSLLITIMHSLGFYIFKNKKSLAGGL